MTIPGMPVARVQRIRAGSLLLLAAPILCSSTALALPSFARQTGKPCAQCHVVAFGPQLTAYGRQFKLNGYVWGDAKTAIPPISLMALGGYSQTAKDQIEAPTRHFSTNDNLSFDQFSVFFGGRVSEHAGAFVQGTYSGEDRHAAWDNFDIRYARSISIGGMGIVYGISVNNNPTVQDLWNSTAAWSFPFISSALVPTPAGAPLIAGGLGQLVLGATGYAMVNDHLYLEAGAYRGLSDRWLSNVGLTPDDNPHLDAPAPYWRAAWQNDKGKNYYSIGVFGLNAKLRPDPAAPKTDRFNDFGVDGTYQYSDGGRNALTANLSLTHEKQTLPASFAAGNSASGSNHLNTAALDVTYDYQQSYVFGVGIFNIQGSSNPRLYAPSQVFGSNNGSPDSHGETLQLEYVPFGKVKSFARPWLNLRLGTQYTIYQKFNGGSNNYDGFGRSARDNNTLFVFAWLAL